jgi:O-methyltransferase
MKTFENMTSFLRKHLRKIALILFFHIPFIIYFVLNSVGKDYGIGRFRKFMLCIKVIYNNRKIKTISFYYQHLVMIEEIFRIPKHIKGDIVECGCYNGSSTANLSLAVKLTNRRLYVCDSFEGLPAINDEDKYDINSRTNDFYIWHEGETAADDGLEGTKRSIKKYGKIEVCEFIKGYFKDTLPTLPTDSIVLIFEDACLVSSVKDCILFLWPKLQYGCKFYSHEPWSQNIVALFYDKQWWENTLNEHIPGFWGSGDGVRVGVKYSQMGYAIKYDPKKIIDAGNRIIHVGLEGCNNVRL